jgi:hypothetical protein
VLALPKSPHHHVALGYVALGLVYGAGAAWLTQASYGTRVWLLGKGRLAPRGWTRPRPTRGWVWTVHAHPKLDLDASAPNHVCVNIIMCVIHIIFSLIIQSVHIKNIIICVINIIIFIITQSVDMKNIIICVVSIIKILNIIIYVITIIMFIIILNNTIFDMNI